MPDDISSEQSEEKLCCDVCGRYVPPEELWWEEDSDIQSCTECRAEEESCGCSD